MSSSTPTGVRCAFAPIPATTTSCSSRTATRSAASATACRSTLPWEPDRHIDYLTPATNLITTKRLTDTTEIDVLFLEPVTLEPTLRPPALPAQGDEGVDTAVGRFDATRWAYTSLDSGWTSDLWVAGDVVVRYDRLFELEWYEAGASGPQPTT